jgi:hypothetical protein
MRTLSHRFFWTIALLGLAPLVQAQDKAAALYTVYGGYSFLSNSPNGSPGGRQGLNGWNGSIAALDWHHLRFKLDVAGYRGTNLDAHQHELVITAGGEYGRRFGKEYGYVEGLIGDAAVNHHWADGGNTGQTASIATLVGGGFDTPLRPRLLLRVQGDFQYTNLNPDVARIPSIVPVYPSPIHGLPNFFARVGAGLAWSF